MSQWGAEGMAEEGYKYYEILSHYYRYTYKRYILILLKIFVNKWYKLYKNKK